MKVRQRIDRAWRRLRYIEYYSTVSIEPPPPDVDAAPMIQRAINEAQRSSEFAQALNAYENRRIKWLYRKPVLFPTVHLKAGTFYVTSSINVQNVTIRGNM